ncbi:long-chain fatty acid--CoA ligase [Caenimonas sedimenti]|uniref:Long-chain fatty acid--CoA ligase n=1 Tax=Caenimonas sedimenti TaxID=2596921 RepID=A0A562ZRF9_9BURK|nr:AMP-binding protein [Caenimonas sedimenti]TWO70967.1 long-chain fatty acid--CoA ligase [Caenimonas sedimenti]
MAASNPVFPHILRHHGDSQALVFDQRTWRYDELHAWAGRAAAVAWHAWGVRPGDRVAWLGGNHPAMIALLFGLARIGATLLPLNFRLAPAEWDQLLADCTPRHLVHDATWSAAAQALAGRAGIAAHGVEALDAEAPEAPDHAAEDAPVLLVYTSGTTGGPKAAVHTQANLLANMRLAAAAQQLGPADTVLTVLPVFHVGGLCIQTLPALHAGARVLLHARFTPEDTLDAIERDRPTLTLQVPATMKALVDHPRWAATGLGGLRAVWAGSSLLPAPLVEAFHARGVPVCNVYGATETGPFSIALPPERAFDHVGSCGWPVPGVEARLGDRHGDAGELLLRGPNVVDRYWPDIPARDADGWFATGDLAQQAADGSYTIVGRARDLIISGGENIHPAEIEQALASHPAVAECAAFGLADARWGEMVAAAVVLHAGAAASDEELLAHLQARLARFKLPRRWFRLESLPKTALGKLQRQALARAVGSPT